MNTWEEVTGGNYVVENGSGLLYVFSACHSFRLPGVILISYESHDDHAWSDDEKQFGWPFTRRMARGIKDRVRILTPAEAEEVVRARGL